MATYKEVRGTKIRDYTTNPDNPIEGDVWYNKTDSVGKYEIPNVITSFRTITSLNTPRNSGAGDGTYTAGIVSFGLPSTAKTETWNGSAWTEVNDGNTARYQLDSSKSGSVTASIVFSGRAGTPRVTNAETWNGTCWAEVNDFNTARNSLGGAGTSTSALGFGGDTGSKTNATEEWNGDGHVTEKISSS